tara:strand:- start:1965 stop:2411 length:447 start_codon:yes stop_codon:yes gene_type:complete
MAAHSDTPPYLQTLRPSEGGPQQAPQQEIKLYTNMKERAYYDNLADLYSILVATEHLEKAYIRDSCTAEEYTPECKKLIGQFRTAVGMIAAERGTDPASVVDSFVHEYNLDCKSAIHRLLVKGIPATIEHDITSTNDGGSSTKGNEEL